MTRVARNQSVLSHKKPLPEATAWNELRVAGTSSTVEYLAAESTQNVEEKKKINNKMKPNRKANRIAKYKQEREKKGIPLLPPKSEKKIKNVKKALLARGASSEELKTTLRKIRREEEQKLQKDLKSICFGCRKPGHKFADCSEKANKQNICFKCGNPDHSSFKCTSGIEGFPLANCFICKMKGHLSKDCPSNDKGIYPKGGCCLACGQNTHLRKDCPTLSFGSEKKKVVAHIIDPMQSADVEVYD